VKGNCFGTDTEIFYNQTGWPQAKLICRDCPILAECRLEFAHDPFADAGGMTPSERRSWNSVRRAPKPRRDSAKATRDMVRKLTDEGHIAARIAAKVGISVSHVYGLQRGFRKEQL
jgi:hypothetical protein